MNHINNVKNNKKDYLNKNININYLKNKIFFNESNYWLFKYIGHNELNIDFSNVYLIKNKNKIQLNLILIKENDINIHILKDIIILENKYTKTNELYVKKKNFIILFILNIIELYKKNKIITLLFCIKNYDFYMLFLGYFKYNYYDLIN